MKKQYLLLAGLALLGQRVAHAEKQVITTWTCRPAASHVPRADPPALRMHITRADRFTTGDFPYWFLGVRDEREWTLWLDNSLELATRYRTEEVVGHPRQYVCGSTYQRAALMRFLSVIRETRICSRQARHPQLRMDDRTTSYKLDLNLPGFEKCQTTIHMGRPLPDRKLFKVVAGWAKLEQSICGSCQLPAEGLWRYLYDYRRQYAGYQ